MLALVLGIMGALGGGLISMLTSAITLRSSHRAEQARWAANRRWQHMSDLLTARRKAYGFFLSHRNAVIMAVGSTMHQVQNDKKVFHQMPPAQEDVYKSLQDSYAQSLLLAGPTLQKLLIEYQNYIDQLVWASWRGELLEAPDGLYENVLAAMRTEVTDLPQP